MTSYTLALLPGDGIGRDVMIEAEKVLKITEDLTPLSFEINKIPCGGQHYLDTGEEWPEGSFEFCRDEADAILLGPSGGQASSPKLGIWPVVRSSLASAVAWMVACLIAGSALASKSQSRSSSEVIEASTSLFEMSRSPAQ